MSDRDALLRAICENPDDDAPRLIYADWLDEHGDPLQAEFIRLQIEYRPSSGLEDDTDPRAKRQLELFRDFRKWRFGRVDWASLGVNAFVRGFSLNWSGTPADFLRIAPHYWRLGPTRNLWIHFDKKPDSNVSQAEEMAQCEWLDHICEIHLRGSWILSDEWVATLLESPYAWSWKVFDLEGASLTGSVCRSLAASALAKSDALVSLSLTQSAEQFDTLGIAALAVFGDRLHWIG